MEMVSNLSDKARSGDATRFALPGIQTDWLTPLWSAHGLPRALAESAGGALEESKEAVRLID